MENSFQVNFAGGDSGELLKGNWVKRLRFVIAASEIDMENNMAVEITLGLNLVIEPQRVSFATSFDKTSLSVMPETMHMSTSASLARSIQLVSAPDDNVVTGGYVETVKHVKFGATSGPLKTQQTHFQAVTRYDNDIMDIVIDTPTNMAVIEGAESKQCVFVTGPLRAAFAFSAHERMSSACASCLLRGWAAPNATHVTSPGTQCDCQSSQPKT